MLPDKTIKNLKRVYMALCSCGSVPYVSCSSENPGVQSILKIVPSTGLKYVHIKVILLTLILHTCFIVLRLFQAYNSRSQKFFLMFIHFAWCLCFVMICWLHITLFFCRFEVLAYFNGLFKFFGSFLAMPGARMSAKCRRKVQSKPCVVDLLVAAFLYSAIVNVLITVQIFLLNKQGYQFVYSVLPHCWKDEFPFVIIFFAIYEIAMPGIGWTLMLFFVNIHLVHLLCTRNYLIMLRRSTQKGILKLRELRHHYRSIQILHNHYNESIASYMPLELFVVISLTYAGNIGTIRLMHSNVQTGIYEKLLFPMVSVITIAFQIIFYQRAGDLHHLSSFYIKSSKKGLFQEKAAKMYLRSFPPLSVKVGTLLDIRKFTVVKFVGSLVVGTARLSILFFR